MTTAIPLTRYDYHKGCFVLNDLEPKPPASPFEWMRFTEEEKARRGGKPLLPASDYLRSTASTRAIEKKRETDSTYGTMPSLKPRGFTVYNKAISSKGTTK